METKIKVMIRQMEAVYHHLTESRSTQLQRLGGKIRGWANELEKMDDLPDPQPEQDDDYSDKDEVERLNSQEEKLMNIEEALINANNDVSALEALKS